MTTLLSPADAEKRLQISERLLRNLKREGAVRYVALSARRIAYRTDDLDEYIDSRIRKDDPVSTAPPPRKRAAQRPANLIPFSEMVGRRK